MNGATKLIWAALTAMALIVLTTTTVIYNNLVANDTRLAITQEKLANTIESLWKFEIDTRQASTALAQKDQYVIDNIYRRLEALERKK